MAAAEDSMKSEFSRRYSHVRRDIGFTDSSNPFYLFLKMNEGLLLLAPSALRCDRSIPS